MDPKFLVVPTTVGWREVAFSLGEHEMHFNQQPLLDFSETPSLLQCHNCLSSRIINAEV